MQPTSPIPLVHSLAQEPIPRPNDPSATTPITNQNPISVHLMVTRFHVRFNRPTERLNFHVSSISQLPKSYTTAFNDPNWKNTMNDEYNSLIKNNTWTLVSRPTDANIVRCMWLFHHKYLADDTLSHYKDCLVANESVQLEGVDETFSLVVKPHTIQAVLKLGSFNYLMGISVTRDSSGMFLSQCKYATEILERTYMVSCNSNRTPVDTEFKLRDDGDPVFDLTLYRSLAASLQYLTFTHPDISYTVQQTMGYSCFHPLLHHWFAYSDADLAGFPITRRSISEAKYLRVANAVAEFCGCGIYSEFRTSLIVQCPTAPTADEC
uniref:Ribonuclease H-like domain-containing protein n=1 Tax=Tanacetum cinerariifolium TaxID=118510 RepID=A0A699HCV3_TANCI|nr:ribonuclease H-like domain-containing protein [Tanacetum cinerariifolium]